MRVTFHPNAVLEITQQLLDLGADEIALGDTTGMANPHQIRSVLSCSVKLEYPCPTSHFIFMIHVEPHLQMHMRYLAVFGTFDGSAAGLGGCPYAPGELPVMLQPKI